ncbi:MAG: hypothetical protein MUF62_06420 [Chitinophagaceae bacterium]|nr:hypothetical protein [Chitinophagaceae bacterium]
MKSTYLLLLALLFIHCGSRKSIYDDNNITERKLDKLIREYSANTGDRELANQVKFAYDFLHNQYQADISRYQLGGTLADKERQLNAYINLQSFYDRLRGYNTLERLLAPGSVGTEIAKTKLELVSGHYELAINWLNGRHWQEARSAYRSLLKVQQWMPDYKDSRQLLRQAKELGTVNAVVLPLRAEGFFYNNNMGNNGFGNNGLNSGPRLSEQLVRDLGGQLNSNGWYRVWAPWDMNRANAEPDWTIEPVWTQLRIDGPRSNRSERRVEKQVEIGKDTAGRPLYKVLSAVLSITEVTYTANGRLEIRINDQDERRNIGFNSWNESYSWQQRWATYRGDAGALSNADWELINAPRDANRNEEALMEQRLLERMYPNLLNWVRGQLNM